MKNNKQYNDQALRIIMQRKAEDSERFELSDGFTDRLMKRIKDEEVASKQKQKSLWLDIVNFVSSAAAVLLIGFFITLHLPFVGNEKHINTNQFISNLPKKSTLEQVYTSYLGQNKKKEISYTQLKRMLYENK